MSKRALPSACGACRLSMSPQVSSRSPTRTAPSGWSSTAKSTTTRHSGRILLPEATGSRPRVTPKRSSTPTKSGARMRSRSFVGCSPSPSGTAAVGRCCWPAIASASSRCTTRSPGAACTSAPRSSRSWYGTSRHPSSISRRSTTICRFCIHHVTRRFSWASASCRRVTCCGGKTAHSRCGSSGNCRPTSWQPYRRQRPSNGCGVCFGMRSGRTS